MDLRSYIRQKGLYIYEFASRINYDRTTVQLVMDGKRKPGKKMINAIVTATNNEVTKDDLLKYDKELKDTDMQ